MSLAFGLDSNNLNESGWGLLMSYDVDPKKRDEILEALQPLLELRESQAGRVFHIFQGMEGAGVFPGETARRFLERNGLTAGPVDPNLMPYYLLIAAPPSQVSFNFQTNLGVQYAVGRVWFNEPEEWYNYALSVRRAESEPAIDRPDINFFFPSHPGDKFTQSFSGFAQALSARLITDHSDWETNLLLGETANRQAIIQMMETDAPRVLFLAGHGLVYPYGDQRQEYSQGGLVCADWPGPSAWVGPIRDEMCFRGEDVPGHIDLNGRLVLQYSSYSLGTPEFDSLSGRDRSGRQLAPQPLLARLPQRLLSLPEGRGALAMVGWVDRVWANGMPDVAIFESSLRNFLERGPVGAAFETFQNRYAELASDLTVTLEEIDFGLLPEETNLADEWAGMQNARGLAIFGDPAARLPEPAPTPTERKEAEPLELISEDSWSGEREVVPATGERLDLELLLNRVGIDDYLVELRYSGGNEEWRTQERAELDFYELQAVEYDIQSYGQSLFTKTLGIPEIYKFYSRAKYIAESRDQPVSLRLVIDRSAYELHSLRWECLYDSYEGAYITLGDRYPFSRYLSSLDWRSIEVRKMKTPSALVAVASPRNLMEYKLEPLDVSSWVEAAQQAMPEVDLTVLAGEDREPLTLNSLARWLREGFDILYLVCHGTTRKDDARLFFEDEDGDVNLVSGEEFAQRINMLARQPRLVFLASNQSAPVAIRLAEAGVPAVLATSEKITIETMKQFSYEFFREMMSDGRADRAASWARAVVIERPDWWSPVLYTRVKGGKIWR